VLFLLCVFSIAACSKKAEQQTTVTAPKPPSPGNQSTPRGTESALDITSLDKIAELERSGRYTPGLGFAESTIKERAGDYAGAVIGAYKEMSWTYALTDSAAENPVTMNQIKEGLHSIVDLYGGKEWIPAADAPDMSEDPQQDARAAVTAIVYFLDNKWAESGEILESLFSEDEEIDSFAQWMILTCALEQKDMSRSVRSRYGAMRSRYAYFPEYWYRLARYLDDDAARMDASERCIILAPKGPYALECRGLIAGIFNIDASRRAAILTRMEIENAVTNAVSSRNPELLRPLFPLLALPDNPYTMYAAGALRALSAEPLYKDFFLQEAARNSGRLNERLVYISRG
jgi:hypothetical protein